MTSAPIPLDTLLAHREWVRTVARAVVRDPNEADDVEQETWLAALRTPPRHAGSLRGWLGAVVRSRARRIGRTDSRREARETAASRDEATASAAQLAEIADTHRRVVQAVVELDEPYRATILLRYFEGLSIDAVASRTGAPIETTRARIKRGVAKLRERLSRELGTKDRPWALALAPLIGASKESTAGVGAAAGVAAAGGLAMAMTTKTAVAAAVVVLLLGIGAVVVLGERPRFGDSPRRIVRAESGARGSDVTAGKVPDAGTFPSRSATPPVRQTRQRAVADTAAPAAAPAPSAKPEPPKETVLERLQKAKFSVDWKDAKILDVLGEIATRSGVEIAVSQEAVEAWGREDKIASFEIESDVAASQILDLVLLLAANGATRWTVEEPRVVIVPQQGVRDRSKPVVVPPPWTAQPTITVVGRVTDAAGVPVAGAEIVRVTGAQERVVAKTDVAGRYEVKLPKPFGSLEAHAEGQQPSFSVGVTGEVDAQVTVDLATRGAGGTVVVRLKAHRGPMPNVLVTVGRSDSVDTTLPDGKKAVQRDRRVYSEEDGEAKFAGIAPGKTTVSVQDSTYNAAPREVEVVAGQVSEVEIQLVRKPTLTETLAKERVTFHFEGAQPGDVVKYLNDAKQLSIVVDPALAASLEGRSISLSVSACPLDEALKALCREIGGVTYDVQGPIVFIRAEKR